MTNRKATLSVYFVPEGLPGRKEATPMMTPIGDLKKQNLIFRLYDTDDESKIMHDEPGQSGCFYTISFDDKKPVSERTRIMTNRFDGTHSRRTEKYYDEASFRITKRDQIKVYLQKLAA